MTNISTFWIFWIVLLIVPFVISKTKPKQKTSRLILKSILLTLLAYLGFTQETNYYYFFKIKTYLFCEINCVNMAIKFKKNLFFNIIVPLYFAFSYVAFWQMLWLLKHRKKAKKSVKYLAFSAAVISIPAWIYFIFIFFYICFIIFIFTFY
jgi:hypothetical protein